MRKTATEGETGDSLMRRLQNFDRSKPVVFTAVSQLRDETQMRQFVAEYTEYLCGRGDQDPAKAALEDIGYWIGYLGDMVTERWVLAFPNIRTLPLGDGIYQCREAYRAGLRRAAVWDENETPK